MEKKVIYIVQWFIKGGGEGIAIANEPLEIFLNNKFSKTRLIHELKEIKQSW
jgi:hypothetical protein